MSSAKLTKRTFQMTFSALFAASLMACGGGGGSAGANSAQLNGVAAYGSPLSSANITITDSTGRQATGITGIDGSYTIDVTGFTAPLLIKASGNTGDAVREYYALVSTTPKAGETATANITPLTHALVAMVSSDGTSPSEFADTAKLKNLDTSTITSALGNLQTSLKDVLINAQLPEKFDPVTTPFKADRSTAADVLLDTIKVSISDQGVALTNARVPASEDSATTPPNVVTIKGIPANPPTSLKAPTIAAADLKGLDNFQIQLNKCLALAPASRATKDSNGNITLQNDCANITSFASDYKGYGYTLNQLWGARFLDSIPENSTVDNPEFLLFLDDGSKAIVRIATRSSNGGRVYFENAAKDNNGTWQIKGNQRNYDASVGVRLNKQTDLSTNGWTIPSTYTNSADKGTNVGKLDAYSSRLNFVFNQQGPNGSDVYAVRVTGPGLPSAGIVLARSSSCGTNDYLAFFKNNGVLPSLAADAPALPSDSGSSAWILDVANYGSNYKGTEFYKQYRGMSTTGSPSTDPQNNIARDPVDMKDIPDFAIYRWEVFTKSSGTTPASSFTSRIITRPLKATEGAKQPWATLSKDALDYLDPTNTTKNGELTTATFSWTLPSATAPAVSSAYLYGSATAGRMNMGQSVPKLGNTSINLSATSEADGNGYVCSYAKVPTFTATSGYREVGLRQTTDRGLTLQQYSYHNGRAAN